MAVVLSTPQADIRVMLRNTNALASVIEMLLEEDASAADEDVEEDPAP